MDLKELKKILLKDKGFAREYEKPDLAMEIGLIITNARIQKGLTQKQLAKVLKTKQPSIARAENGKSLPNLRFLDKIAKALHTDLIPPKFTLPTGGHIYTSRGVQDQVEHTEELSQDVSPELVYYTHAHYSGTFNYKNG